MQEDSNFKIILGYLASLRLAWNTLYYFLKKGVISTV